jgi:predicted transcriptional regulator
VTSRRRSRTPRRNEQADALPEAELEVLAVLHRLSEADAVEVGRALQSWRPLSHSSVVTLLRRLESKKLVGRRKADQGKAFVYFPTQPPGATYSSVLGRLMQRVFHQDSLSLVTSLFAVKPPTRSEVDELRKLLDEVYPKGKKTR